MERVPVSEQDFLENDQTIPGQNYCCISFISPDELIKQKELFMFHKYMTQQCGEYEKNIDEILEKTEDDLKNKICSELREKVRAALKYNYDGFKDEFDNFKYRFKTELDTAFDKSNNYQTSMRGVKVRGVYSTYNEAQMRAKRLQSSDRSFHVFVGQVGFWLPWDPCADNIQDEEYMETELNTLMKAYQSNQIAKDMFYDERKKEKMEDAVKERLANEKKLEDSLQEEDPWMAAKLKPSTNDEASITEIDESTTQENSGDVKSV